MTDKANSDTPRTDDMCALVPNVAESFGFAVNLCRQLECELAAATWELNDRRGLDKSHAEERIRLAEALNGAVAALAIQQIHDRDDPARVEALGVLIGRGRAALEKSKQ